MRILHIIGTLKIGGAEKLLVDSLPIYKKRNLEVELLLLDGIRTPYCETLEKEGVKIHYLHKYKLWGIYNPLFIWQIIPFLKNYDICHVHLFPALYWVAFAKLFSVSRVRLVFTEHSTGNSRMKYGIWRVIERFVYRRYDKIVSISEGVEQAIKNHLSFSDNEKFQVINNGVVLSAFSKGAIMQFPAQTGNKQLIQVSRFGSQKDQITVINAMVFLPEDVFLTFVGVGGNMMRCRLLVKELGLSERVSFLGARIDIPDLLKQADIVLQSSHWEGFGLAAIEGMAAAKPVIASDVPGLRDVVQGAGLLFRKGDAADLADKISSLLADRELYENVVEACRKRALNYDINKMADDYMELYTKITQ
ncbi:glycosyltransferase family 4 protein [Parabacteroides sp. OttesenSCG-928-G06]|nr:glycosyltransferase family 4 protein [Parabacteroides sp. OttesenSCG-928-G06]